MYNFTTTPETAMDTRDRIAALVDARRMAQDCSAQAFALAGGAA